MALGLSSSSRPGASALARTSVTPNHLDIHSTAVGAEQDQVTTVGLDRRAYVLERLAQLLDVDRTFISSRAARNGDRCCFWHRLEEPLPGWGCS